MDQKTVLVSGEKGGGGKTTLASNLAVLCARAGHDVVLVDADKARNSAIWGDLRKENGAEPRILVVEKLGMIGADITALKSKFSTIIIDAGGRDTVEMRQSMAICDYMLVPARPSFFDAATITNLVDRLHEIRQITGTPVNAVAVLNACSSNARSKEEAIIRRFLAQFIDVLPVMDLQVSDLVAFRVAGRTGVGVVELPRRDASDKASLEIEALYKEIFK